MAQFSKFELLFTLKLKLDGGQFKKNLVILKSGNKSEQSRINLSKFFNK